MKRQFENIEIRWAAQLSREHRIICHRYGVLLSPPAINISSGQKRLGSWDAGTKTISISGHLIRTEIWDIVIEVLKHEMAHQYVSEYDNHADSHGKYFKLACKKLGVHPAFAAGGRNHDQQLQAFKGDLPSEAQSMIRKVEKLTALGQSGNEAEALSASRKANYLLNKYNLEHAIPHTGHPDIHYLTICHKKKRIESIQRAVLSVLKSFYYVDCLTSDTYHAQDDTMYKSIVLIGKKEALTVAEYVYHFLLDSSRTAWQKFKKQARVRQRDKVSFDMGFVAGIEQNHKTMSASSPACADKNDFLPVKAVNAIMAKARADNQAEMNRLFPRLRSIRYGRHHAASTAFNKGFEDGRKTQVKKGIPCPGTDPPGLLQGRTGF